MSNISLSENNVAQYLKELTDTTQFLQEQIMVNLKDCLKGNKCCVFSCGANIDEHKDKFEQIKKDKSFITCCIKSSIEHLQFEADILVLYGLINGTYLENEKIKTMFILKSETFEYNGISYDLSNFIMTNLTTNLYNITTDIFNIINFLKYIGIKEINLFGFYLADYIINDLTNYNYYDDIVCKNFHLYDTPFSRTKEPGIIIEHCGSIQLAQYCIDNDISLYNVSEHGCLSNKIKRINFESIFLNEKRIIFSKMAYKDFFDEFDEKVDIDFYYERNCNNSNYNIVTLKEKKEHVFNHLIFKGLNSLKNVNRYDTKKEICLNEFIKDIMCLISYISYYPPTIITYYAFFCHYLLKFNKVFNVCFYNDFDKISCPKFYDDLLLLHLNDINNINFDNFYHLEINIPKYNNNKYFKLFIYLFHLYKSRYENILDDFNAKEYIVLNDDLKHMSEIEAKLHYEYNGYRENRKYKYENIPLDFNAKEYIELNQDLYHMTELEAKKHYEYTGYKENREYRKNISE